MTIYDKYKTKRIKEKIIVEEKQYMLGGEVVTKKVTKNKYYTQTYDQEGKEIGNKIPWKGSNKKNTQIAVEVHNKAIARKDLPLKEWKNEGYTIPKNIRYTDSPNVEYPFEYQIAMRVLPEDSKDKNDIFVKMVTVTGREPLTRKEIEQRLKEMIKKNGAKDIKYNVKMKSFKIERLVMKKGHEYKVSYKKPVRKSPKGRKKKR